MTDDGDGDVHDSLNILVEECNKKIANFRVTTLD